MPCQCLPPPGPSFLHLPRRQAVVAALCRLVSLGGASLGVGVGGDELLLNCVCAAANLAWHGDADAGGRGSNGDEAGDGYDGGAEAGDGGSDGGQAGGGYGGRAGGNLVLAAPPEALLAHMVPLLTCDNEEAQVRGLATGRGG
eukprot:89285-Chlamydomonas_euryale.AAC.1